jgi:hypothetical protein
VGRRLRCSVAVSVFVFVCNIEPLHNADIPPNTSRSTNR